MATNSNAVADDKIWYIIAYVLSFITGFFVLIIKGEQDQRLKMHAMQAIFLGVISIIIWVLFGLLFFFGLGIIGSLLNLLVWLYGLYVGFEGYNGKDIKIPVITDYAKRYSGYGQKSASKK